MEEQNLRYKPSPAKSPNEEAVEIDFDDIQSPN